MTTIKHKSQFAFCKQALFKAGSKAGFVNGEVVDYMGNQSRPVQLGRAYNFDGVDDAIFRSMVGVTIVSWSGTATLSVGGGNDRINSTAGTAWNIRLSDGTFYKCDEGGGTLAFNSGTSGIDGTITNANLTTFHTTFTNGQGADWQNSVGYTPAIRVNTGQETRITNAQTTAITPVSTIDFYWVDTTSVINRGLIEMRAGVSANDYLLVYTNTGNIQATLLVGGVTQFNMVGSFAFVVGVRYHVQLVRNNANAYIFINGNQVATTNTSGTATLNTSDLVFGRLPSNSPNYPTNGWLYNLRFSRIARNTANFTPPLIWTDYNLSEDGLVFFIANNQFLYNPFNLALTNTSAGVLVPRNENNTAQDDLGNTLFFSQRAKYNAQLRQSNCVSFDGTDDNIQVPLTAIGTSNYEVEIRFIPQVLGGNRNLFFFGNGTFTRIRLRSGGGDILQATINGFNTPDLISGITIGQTYHIRLTKTGNSAVIRLNNVIIYQNTGSITGSLPATNHRIGSNNSGGADRFGGQLFDYKLTIAGVPFCDFPMQEGSGNRIYSRVNNHVGVMNNFNLTNAWAVRQNVFHNNLLNGFEEYTDGGSGLIRVPLSLTGTSLGVVIAGFTSQGIRTAGTWHNKAETTFRNFQAPELLQNDVSNTYFTAGVPNNVAFGVNETTRLKNTRPNANLLGNIRLYSLNTGEK